MKEQVCLICEVPWKDGKGFIGKHKMPCANAAYGWAYTKDKPTKMQKATRLMKKIFCDALKINRNLIIKI